MIVSIIKILLIILFDIFGFVGAVVPAIPGPPLCLIGLLIAFFGFEGSVSVFFLIVSIILCLICATLEYFSPAIVTKWGGGSKWAAVGSTIGLIVGLFFPPVGILWIPLVGAFIGELIANFKLGKAFKVALLSFISFLLTMGIKLISCGIISLISLKACF